ncbi:SIR2 family protein, partial [Klebsiella pneumoniae]|uniref:SIR2 family protein n=1 Tax=Klebsiella pneumoniae TaxID=573 RepID=UPI00216A22AF
KGWDARKRAYCLKIQPATGSFARNLIYSTKPPDYKVYTGQNELLFSNPQSIAEIYKIHGSAHKPKSLVLTDYDYADFNLKNPYLAAKLITIFVEHPVVFLGYSLSDKNISDLLSAISVCIGSENLHQLRNNLIFVQREGDAANLLI